MFSWSSSKKTAPAAKPPVLLGRHKDLQPGDVVLTIRNPKHIEALNQKSSQAGNAKGKWVSANVLKKCGEQATVVKFAGKDANGNQAEDRYVLRFADGQTFTRRRAYISAAAAPAVKKTPPIVLEKGEIGWPDFRDAHVLLLTKGEAVLTFRDTKLVEGLSKSEVDDALIRTGEAAHVIEIKKLPNHQEGTQKTFYVVQFEDKTAVRRQGFYMLKMSEMIEDGFYLLKDESDVSAKSIFEAHLAKEMEQATVWVQTQMQHAEEKARQEVAEAERRARAAADKQLKETREAVEANAFERAKRAASSNALAEIRRVAAERLAKKEKKTAKFDESGFPLNDAARNYCVAKWASNKDDVVDRPGVDEDSLGIGYLGTFCVDYVVLQQATNGFAEEFLLGRGGSCKVFRGKVYILRSVV
jgi:hypothetical protein